MWVFGSAFGKVIAPTTTARVKIGLTRRTVFRPQAESLGVFHPTFHSSSIALKLMFLREVTSTLNHLWENNPHIP